MKRRAAKPFQFGFREDWFVSVRYTYEPGQTPGVAHGTFKFATEDEALAFVAEINGRAN
jgi:hypothetical protein